MRVSLAGISGLVLALGIAVPVQAQDEYEVDVVPTEEPSAEPAMEEYAPAEEPSYEEAPAESYEEAPASSYEEAPAEMMVEEAPAEEYVAEEEPEPAEPINAYLGVDQVTTVVSLSTPGASGASTFDSGMYRFRAGVRAFEAVGIELHYGIDNNDEEPGSVETDSYYGAYLVPTATVFEVVELAFPVGYAWNSFGSTGQTQDYDSIAYGADLELPLRSFSDSLPDVRLTGGGMVYHQKTAARVYGWNLGLRYDFQLPGFHASSLWPF